MRRIVTRVIAEAHWSQLSAVIAESMGLHFPSERRDDLERGIASAAPELGFEDISECVAGLLSRPLDNAQLQTLASHLTIGETYFFRDRPTMAALSNEILPGLIDSRRGREQRLRFWSAACCTGEEPYSLAILLHQLLPDLGDWQITITATDINGRFLKKADAGVYGEWSFRDTPAHVKQRYFERPRSGQYAIVPEIRRLVKFEHLNLVDDVYPSLETGTNAMDLILCRNALMYFTASQTINVVGKLYRALVAGGWLVVSAAEASQRLFAQFAAVNRPGAILYRKTPTGESDRPWRVTPETLTDVTAQPAQPAYACAVPVALHTQDAADPSVGTPPATQPPPTALSAAQTLYDEGQYAEAVQTLLDASGESGFEPAAFSLLARALANQGRLADALTWCERWIAADKLDATARYLQAVVLLEQGAAEEAHSCLQRAVYLEPDFVLAHFALGNIARGRGRTDDAARHFGTALRLLSRHAPGDLLPESDSLTAGRLTETLTSMINPRGAS